LVLESTGEGVTNPVVNSQQLLTSKGHRSDAHHRDQRGDQAIFDGGDADSSLRKRVTNFVILPGP